MTTNNAAGLCRNCGQTGKLQDLGFIGQLAPFFLKRVFGIQVAPARSPTAWKQFVRRLLQLPQSLLDRNNRPTALVEMQLCASCTFIQTKLPFHEDAINRLYLDYRQDSYNRERIEYEPSYASIVAEVGSSALELESRLSAATAFLKKHVTPTEDFTILDFGGSDGKFMPRLAGHKFVFEISSVEPVAGITRVDAETGLQTYSLVQLAHVVEHVVDPLSLVTYVASKVAPGGYLYIETPQEISADEREKLLHGNRIINIHEHINSFNVQSVTRLMQAAGLVLIDIEATPIDAGWAKAVHIRALGRKTQ